MSKLSNEIATAICNEIDTGNYDETIEAYSIIIEETLEKTKSPSFHEAWGRAKDKPDYDKKAWIYVQKYLEDR